MSTAATHASRRFVGGVLAVTLAGLALRIVYGLVVAPQDLGFDAIWYVLQGETLANGHGYIDPDAFFRFGQSVPTANFPPLWPLLIAGARHVGLDDVDAYRVLGSLIGASTIAVTAVIGARVVNRRVGLVAASIVAVSPALVAADGSLMADSLYVALITVAVLVAYTAIESPAWWRFALLGGLLGLAFLARSDALFVAPLLVAVTAWGAQPVPPGRRLALGLGSAGVLLLVLLPWGVRNQLQMGQPAVLSSNSGSMLEGANCPSTYSGTAVGAWDARCLRETRRAGESELAWANAGREAGIDYARDHSGRLPLVGATRLLRAWSIWNPVDQAQFEQVETRIRGWQTAAGVFTLLLLVAAGAGALRLVRDRRSIAPLVAVVVGTSITAVTAYGNTRFTLAAQPALAVAAAALVGGVLVPRQSRVVPTTETNDTISPG
jgi:4-amino-4-deoxy-L-arabinose transferase-like glycosyltransferase